MIIPVIILSDKVVRTANSTVPVFVIEEMLNSSYRSVNVLPHPPKFMDGWILNMDLRLWLTMRMLLTLPFKSDPQGSWECSKDIDPRSDVPRGLSSLSLAFLDCSVLDVSEKLVGSSPQSLCPHWSMAAAANLLIQVFVCKKQLAFLLLTPASLAPDRMPCMLQARQPSAGMSHGWMKGSHRGPGAMWGALA